MAEEKSRDSIVNHKYIDTLINLYLFYKNK